MILRSTVWRSTAILLGSLFVPGWAHGAGIQQVSAGDDFNCALRTSGGVICWGYGGSACLGNGSLDDVGKDAPAWTGGDVPVGGTVAQISAGYDHSCARLTGGTARCWGDGLEGQLGYGNQDDVGLEITVADAGDINVGATVLQIAAGDRFTCALITGGNVRCWGDGTGGHLGYGNELSVGDAQVPATAGNVAIGGVVTQIAVGAEHSCALLSGGKVRCWGVNYAGELGYGNLLDVGDHATPAAAGDVNVGGVVTQITAGDFHTCALLDTGAVRCWGGADHGELGYGNLNDVGDDETPASAGNVNLGGRAVEISAGSDHTCALLDTGHVRCWGSAAHGQLGYGNSTNDIGDDETPASAGDVPLGVGVSVQHIGAGGDHTCALTTGGGVRCWGRGNSGQLGYGNDRDVGDTPGSLALVGDVPLTPTNTPLPRGSGWFLAVGLLALGTFQRRSSLR